MRTPATFNLKESKVDILTKEILLMLVARTCTREQDLRS